MVIETEGFSILLRLGDALLEKYLMVILAVGEFALWQELGIGD